MIYKTSEKKSNTLMHTDYVVLNIRFWGEVFFFVFSHQRERVSDSLTHEFVTWCSRMPTVWLFSACFES